MPGTVDEVNCRVSPTPTILSLSSTSGGGDVHLSPAPSSSSSFANHQESQPSREFKDFNGIRTWGSRSNNSRSSSALDRHSESSESLDNHSSCSANGGRQMQDFIGSSEYIPTRSTKAAPKVAYNPMQFVKTGPTKLAQTAQEQLKKAEEVKKVRETKKDDAEDWQSNLEGWKSSRRKRQEHVIERVTEVKRMEQEEALKASEAATRRLIGIREKRGKLSALYSVEDNDEIEFQTNVNDAGIAAVPITDHAVDSSPDSSVFDAEEQSISQQNLAEKAASITTTTPPDDLAKPAQEYSYEKSIEDYVKFSTTVLSKQQQETTKTTTSCSRKIETHNTWTKSRMEEEVVEKRQETTKLANQQPPEATDKNNKTATTASDSVDLVVVKRRSMFEREGLATSTTEASDKASMNAANRRSGEFSSTFKNRLSTFEMTEAGAPNPAAASRVTPDRDPHFKNKLATFHKVGEPTTLATVTPSNTLASAPAAGTEAEDKPNFKAKLAAFRQVEEKTSTKVTPATKMNKPAITAAKPVIPVSVKAAPVVRAIPPALPTHPQPPPFQQEQTAKTVQVSSIQPEPIYANSSVAMAGSSLSSGHQRIDAQSPYSSVHRNNQHFGRAGDAESFSDCTEDEGIRSLSPHGTPSPTSPTPDGMEPLPPPLPSHPPVGYSPYSFQQQQQQREMESEIEIAESSSSSGSSVPPQMAWPPAEAIIWDDWVDLGAVVQNAAPPSEKPPPPPVSSNPTDTHVEADVHVVIHHSTRTTSTSTTCSTPTTSTTSTTSTATSHQQVALRNSERTGGSEPNGLRQELRKRRSDFLGFDVNAMEDDAKEMADAIPPPPDLKTLLRNSATDYRASEFGVPEWQPPSPPHEEELARKEREIIETLEKEEKERTVRSSSASGSDLHNNSATSDSGHGIEYEMTAEIDQLAREWQTGSSMRRTSTKFQQQQEQMPLFRPEGEVKQLHVDVNISTNRQLLQPLVQPTLQMTLASPSSSSSCVSGAIGWTDASNKLSSSSTSPQPPPPPQQQQQQQQIQSQLSPPKPSRLSAAPKPKLHDGEAWMAKRKVASEGGSGGTAGTGRKDMKDVSRHWLIQEAEQRRIDAMQERKRNYSPLSSSSSLQLTPPTRPLQPTMQNQQNNSPPGPPGQPSSVNHMNSNNNSSNGLMVGTSDGHHWMSRSSSSTSVDKMSDLRMLGANHKGMDHSFRSTSSLGSSPTPRPLYVNQEEILEYADFTGAPHTAPPVWQVRSLVSSGSMDQLQSLNHHHLHGSIQQPPLRPAKSQSQTLPSSSSCAAVQQLGGSAAQTQPSWRSTHPPETQKEPIAPLPHSVITTLTQRMTQRSNNNNNANYGDYMNVQEATLAQQQQQQSTVLSTTRAGPQVPAQRPANYRHPSVVGPSHSAPVQSTTVSGTVHQSQHQNNNDRMLSVSGKKKCSLCQEELGRGAAMIIESLRLFYHINCFRCCVCGIALGNGTAGTDVRVRNNNLHCHDCYSNDDGLKFSKV